MNTDDILTQRGSTYGSFCDNSQVSQKIKDILTNSPNWRYLKADQKEALHMIAHKIARIVCGDPNYIDSWVDISGYATLVTKRLEQINQETNNVL